MLIVVSHPRIASRYTSLRRLIISRSVFSRFRRGSAPVLSLSLIVPRKQNVKSEDVIKESLRSIMGRIERMNTEFMVLAATTINNPTFVSLSSASFSYPSCAILPSFSLSRLLFLLLFPRLSTRHQDFVSQH